MSEWESSRFPQASNSFHYIELLRLNSCSFLATPVQGRPWRPPGVNYRTPLKRSGAVRRAIEILATLGTALLFSYLILQTRW